MEWQLWQKVIIFMIWRGELGRNPLALGQNFVSSINRELDWVNHIGVSSSLFYKFIERQLGKTPE